MQSARLNYAELKAKQLKKQGALVKIKVPNCLFIAPTVKFANETATAEIHFLRAANN